MLPNNTNADTSQTFENKTLHAHTLDSIVNQTNVVKTSPQIKVGHSPESIVFVSQTNTIYVANSDSDSVSVIDGIKNMKIKDIPVAKNPSYLAINGPDMIYVANSGSDSVSVIDGTNNSKIKDIPVGVNPSFIAAADTNTVYVANTDSDSISVIDGVTNNVVAGVIFNVNPANSGHITCNGLDSPINQYLYISADANCIAKPNKGFELSSWVENLGHNSTRTIKSSTVSGSPLNSILDVFGIKPNDTAASLNVTQFGTFTANFRALPPPIPPEYWIPLYGVIVSSIVGWSIPSIIGWIKAKKQIGTIHQYRKIINSLYSDGKLDEGDIEPLDALKRDITDAYVKAKITEQHYSNLKNEISRLYEEVYKNKIYSLNGKFDSSSNGIQLDKIKNDISDAYAAEKITEQHYNLLNEKISDYKNNNKSVTKLSSFEDTVMSAAEGGPIKTNK
jgi:YVTN family beta-propeller protein